MNKPVIVIPPGIKTPFLQCPPAQQQLINRSLDPLSYSVNKSNTGQSLSGRFLQPIQTQQVLQPIQSQPLRVAQPQLLQPIQSQQVLQPIQSQQILQPLQSQPQAIPVSGMISAPQVGLQNQKLRLEPYTEKSFIIRGDTRPHKTPLKTMKGKWINKPRDGGDPGWMFGNRNRPTVEAYVQSVNRGTTQPQSFQPIQTTQPQSFRSLQTTQPQLLQPIQTTQPQSFRSLQPQLLQPVQTTQPQSFRSLQPQLSPAGTRNTIDPATGLVGYGNIRLPQKISTNVVGQAETSGGLPRFLPVSNIESKYQGLSVDQKMDLILGKLDQLLGGKRT